MDSIQAALDAGNMAEAYSRAQDVVGATVTRRPSSRLTEALKELADALPRNSDGVQLHVTVAAPYDALERIGAELEASTRVAGHLRFGVRCGHVDYTFQVASNSMPLVDLR